jgi:hypothetical protein
VPHQRLRPAAASALGLAALVALSACSSSAPAQLGSASPAAAATVLPNPSESLLGPSDDAHSAVGRVVDGFPADLVPVPSGAKVLMSSAEPVDGSDLVQISLNVRSSQDAAGLLAAVGDPLVAAGFTAVPPQSEPALAAQGAYTRGDGELVTAGVLDRDGVRTLTVGGTVRVSK